MLGHRQGDVFIHGITQRSGTNYLMELLALNPCLNACPQRIWEFPHLRYSNSLLSYNGNMATYPKVLDMESEDLLPFFGDALLAYASQGLDAEQRVLLKEPSVEGLPLFFKFFPGAFLIIVIRDGRDVACSAMRTSFAAPPVPRLTSPRTYRCFFEHPHAVLAKRWVAASRIISDFLVGLDGSKQAERVLVVRYEDLVAETSKVMERVLGFLGLDADDANLSAFSRIKVKGSSFVNARNGRLDWNRSDMDPSELKSVGRWKQWSDKEKARYLRLAEESLRRWGYLD